MWRIGYIFFGREAARRNDDPGPGGDDQGAAGASERGAESLDGVPVYLTISRPLREVVDEGCVNHAFAGTGAGGEALCIRQIAPMRLYPPLRQLFCGVIAARQSEHLMARVDEFLNNGRTDKACRTCDEDTHYDFSFTRFMTTAAFAARLSSRWGLRKYDPARESVLSS